MKAEFVYENMKFERGVNPRKAMGIGMRERIKKMMKEDKWKYRNDDNTLIWASRNGHTDIVEFLLKAGADVHYDNDFALRWASDIGHKDIVKVLLKAGADVHAKNNEALRWALESDHKDIVKLLKKWMKKNESFIYENIHFKRGLDPKAAMGIGMRERIKEMMEEDNWSYEGDHDSLCWASYKGYKDIVKLLLKAEVNVHIGDDQALRWASQYGHIDVVELLLKAGADVHAFDNYALYWASRNGHEDVVKLLKKWMKKNESFVYENIYFERGVDPRKAMGIGMREKIKIFLFNQNELFSPNTNLSDEEMLLYCCKHGKTNWVKFLIDEGANAVAFSNSPLKWARIKKFKDIINILLKAGADPKYLDPIWSHQQDLKDIKKNKKYKWKNYKKWLLGENINFTREGDPYDKLRIGKYRHQLVKTALLNNPTDVEDEIDSWLKRNPTLAEELKFNPYDPLAKTDLLCIELDYYCEENNIERDDMIEEFTKEWIDIITNPGEVNVTRGTLPDGSKVLFYQGGLIDGFITRKEWLK